MADGQEKPIFDSDVAFGRLRDHWLLMAEKWQGRAMGAGRPDDALAWASLAADAFWTATGESSGLRSKAVFDAYRATPNSHREEIE